ncbi:MAG: TfoX/Sxy family protein [Candidatus Thermoplasmatota archaeon]
MGNLDLLEDACDRARLTHTTRAMFGGHGLFAPNGGMFAGIVDEDRIILKLADEATRSELISLGTKPWAYKSKMGQTEMREWILAPEAFYDEPEQLAAWAKRAHAMAPAKGAKRSDKKAGAKTAKNARK